MPGEYDESYDGKGNETKPILAANRRQFMQTTGIGLAGLAGIGGPVSGQIGLQEDNSIELKATGSGEQLEHVDPEEHDDVSDDVDHIINWTGGQHTWLGVLPNSIEEEHNPTLTLTEGDEYSLEWVNETDTDHNFVIEDTAGDEVLSTEFIGGDSSAQTIEFTATEQLAAYYSESSPTGMRGTIEVSADDELFVGDISYEYYEGNWSTLPPFGNLDPVDSGTTPQQLISLSPSEQETGYGFVFEWTVTIGDMLDSGTYTFTVESDPGCRLLVDGSELIDSPGSPADESAATELAEGAHQFRLEYADSTGAQKLNVGWTGPYDELLPRISADDPLRTADEFDWEIEARREPASKRMDMPGSSTRSLSIGLPPNTNYCFDTTTATVQYGWRGAFLDSGPMTAYGSGRGNDPGNILGTQFSVGAVDYPLRIGSSDSEPEVEFVGYRESPYPPELLYTIDDYEVNQTVEPVSNALGLEYTFEFNDPPSESIYFVTDTNADIDREASVGTWSNNVLEIPSDESVFSITIRSTGGDN